MNQPEFQVKGLDKFHANTTIEFTEAGLIIHVSLNVEPEVAQKLCPLNVFQGKQFWVYKLKKLVPSRFITKTTIQMVQNELLKNCMSNIRVAKIKVLENQIKTIQS